MTETFDGRPAKAPMLLKLMGVERTHPRQIEATLERLEKAATAHGDPPAAPADTPPPPIHGRLRLP